MGELRVVGDPRAAERHCEEDEDDSDVVNDIKTFSLITYCVKIQTSM